MTQLTGFPDFFVVGAPRCGTTALCRYLASNPQICLSRPKEPHYFARYSGVSSAAKIQRDYIDRYFAHRGSAHRAVGEGSVSYLYLPGVITRILEFNPEARFIAMVRSPLTMLPSYHLRMQYLLQEDEADFATAWRQQEVRARGENVPRRCLETRLLMYGEVTRFGQQVDTLFKVAGRERAHVIVFEDFVANTLMEYRNVLKFLHVDYDGQTRFVRRYQSQMYRHRWLQELIFLPVALGGKMVLSLQRRRRTYKADGSSKKRDWIKRLTDWNKVPTEPQALSPGMRAVVSDHLRSDVELLSRLLNRDLGFWLDPPG